MASAFKITDKNGDSHVLVTARIKGVEVVPGEPAEPAVEAADAVEDDPGEEPTAANPAGRPPKKGHDKIEASPGKPAVPESCIIHTEDGDHEVPMSSAHVLQLINLG